MAGKLIHPLTHRVCHKLRRYQQQHHLETQKKSKPESQSYKKHFSGFNYWMDVQTNTYETWWIFKRANILADYHINVTDYFLWTKLSSKIQNINIIGSMKYNTEIFPLQLVFSTLFTRADSRFWPSQWETALLCNNLSHWLHASLESDLYTISNVRKIEFLIHTQKTN